jgi:hypothetical protein
MAKLIDITKQKFGKLTAIKRVYPNGKRGEPRWLCKCDCGKEKVIYGENLKSNKIKSCGCLRKEITSYKTRLIPKTSNIQRLIYVYKIGAKKRGLDFNLTEKQFAELTQRDCYYCGAKPNNIDKHRKKEYVYNGIDRVDNSKGYEIYNVVPCCKECNKRKGTSTLLNSQDWIERVYNKTKEPEIEIQNRLLYYPGD